MRATGDVVSGSLSVEGAELHYELAGRGDAVIFLHAGVADRRMWDPQFTDLKHTARVVRYDRQGFGASSRPRQAFAHRHDLRGLMDRLEIERAHLVGCSQGGGVALDFALAYPGRTVSLILESSTVGGYTPTGPIPAPLVQLAEALQEEDYHRAGELAVQIWLVGPFRCPEAVPEVLRESFFEQSLTALPNYFVAEDPLKPPAFEQLSELQLPVLVIAGGLDDPGMLTLADVLADKIPKSKKIIFPEAAHFPNLEQPDEFNQQVRAILAGRPRAL